MKIKEIIVVEGKSDTIAVRRAVEADTIETNGSAINEETLKAIAHAQKKRGVIIFTDPDHTGERIRKRISDAIPGCKHAFLTRKEAFKNKASSLGIEHATPDTIRKALQSVYTESVTSPEWITKEELVELGLIGGANSGERRRILCELLKIGYANGKQLYKRLKMFQVTKGEFWIAYNACVQEEEK